jgi:hypothetical protein
MSIAWEVLVEGYAIACGAEEISERAFAVFKRLLAEIIAVELDQIEGAEHCHIIVIPIAEQIEDR